MEAEVSGVDRLGAIPQSRHPISKPSGALRLSVVEPPWEYRVLYPGARDTFCRWDHAESLHRFAVHPIPRDRVGRGTEARDKVKSERASRLRESCSEERHTFSVPGVEVDLEVGPVDLADHGDVPSARRSIGGIRTSMGTPDDRTYTPVHTLMRRPAALVASTPIREHAANETSSSFPDASAGEEFDRETGSSVQLRQVLVAAGCPPTCFGRVSLGDGPD